MYVYIIFQDVFNTADPLPPDQLVQLYHNYLEEIEEENHKRKLEDEEYEKRKQKLVRYQFISRTFLVYLLVDTVLLKVLDSRFHSMDI